MQLKNLKNMVLMMELRDKREHMRTHLCKILGQIELICGDRGQRNGPWGRTDQNTARGNCSVKNRKILPLAPGAGNT